MWFSSYLSNRRRRVAPISFKPSRSIHFAVNSLYLILMRLLVALNGQASEWTFVKAGVPYGLYHRAAIIFYLHQ